MADRHRDCKQLIQFATMALSLGALSLAAGMTNPCYGQQSVNLEAKHTRYATSRVTLTLELKGNVQKDVQIVGQAKVPAKEPTEKTMRFPLSVAGRLMYDEVLGGVRGGSQVASESARYYHHADANIQVGKNSDKITLREDRRILAATEAASLVSVDGPISREELDLIEVPGNSLIVDRLLPNKAVATGSKWSQDAEEFGRLVNWTDVETGQIECQLQRIENGLAIVAIAGSLDGTSQGADSKVQIQGEYRYDVHWGRITWLQLDLDEERKPGLVHPGFDVVTELRMRVEPLKASIVLTESVVNSALKSSPSSKSLLVLEPQASDVELVHDRRWHVTGDLPRRTVMRCLDDDLLLAQLTVSELAKLPEGRELSLEDFQADIQKALGDRFREFVSANQGQQGEFRTLRVVASGVVGDVPIQWIYYHMNDSAGRRAAHVYILESENLEDFAHADREMVAGFKFRPRAGASLDRSIPAATARQQPVTNPSTASQSSATRPNSTRPGPNPYYRPTNQARVQGQQRPR